jgi:hypothetical protein
MKFSKLIIPFFAILTGTSGTPIAEGSNIVVRDACTTGKTQWIADCEYGANVCCSKINTKETQCRDKDNVSGWCSSHFSGQNCAHAYNEGARYIENLTGYYCGFYGML